MSVKIIHPINPFVCVIDNFFPPEKCDKIIKLAQEKGMDRSKTGDDPENPIEDYRRTSKNVFLPFTETVVAEFLFKAANVLKVRPEQAEQLQVVTYDLGQEYGHHHDAFPAGSKQITEEPGGQRVATALMYLQAPTQGGATEFPRLPVVPDDPGYEVLPKKGRCVFFTTTFLGQDNGHPWSYHGSAPVVTGEKWACNLWFRQGQVFRFGEKEPGELYPPKSENSDE